MICCAGDPAGQIFMARAARTGWELFACCLCRSSGWAACLQALGPLGQLHGQLHLRGSTPRDEELAVHQAAHHAQRIVQRPASHPLISPDMLRAHAQLLLHAATLQCVLAHNAPHMPAMMCYTCPGRYSTVHKPAAYGLFKHSDQSLGVPAPVLASPRLNSGALQVSEQNHACMYAMQVNMAQPTAPPPPGPACWTPAGAQWLCGLASGCQ